jgi:hypothetical protein
MSIQRNIYAYVLFKADRHLSKIFDFESENVLSVETGPKNIGMNALGSDPVCSGLKVKVIIAIVRLSASQKVSESEVVQNLISCAFRDIN